MDNSNSYKTNSPEYQLRDIIISETRKAHAYEEDVKNYQGKAKTAWDRVELYQTALSKLDEQTSVSST